jgi:hypothetical protein
MSLKEQDLERLRAIEEVIANDTADQLVPPSDRALAMAELSGIEEGRRIAGPSDDDFLNWMHKDFMKSDRRRRVEILTKWQARRLDAGGLWGIRERELQRLHNTLWSAGR